MLRFDRIEWLSGGPRADEVLVDPEGVVRRHDRPVPVQVEGLPTDGSVSIPVSRGGQVVGRFRLVAASRAVRPSPEELRAAVLLASSVVREIPETRAS